LTTDGRQSYPTDKRDLAGKFTRIAREFTNQLPAITNHWAAIRTLMLFA
jgi:hypothetical protein